MIDAETAILLEEAERTISRVYVQTAVDLATFIIIALGMIVLFARMTRRKTRRFYWRTKSL